MNVRTPIVVCAAALLVALGTTSVQAQGRGMRGGSPLTRLLGMAEVQNELKLDPHILEKVKAFAEESQTKLRDEMQMIRDQGLSEEDARAEMAAAIEQFTQKGMEELSKLLSADQMKRFKQLMWQQQGPAAVLQPEVGDAIGLSAEERAELQTKVDELNSANREKMQQLFQDGDRDQIQKVMEENRKALEELVMNALDDDEKSKFEALKGPAFTFPAPQAPANRRRDF